MSTEQTAVATTGWPLISSLVLGALPTAAGCARLHARNVTTEWGLSNIAETVELVVSEIVTNAVRATTGPDGRPRYEDEISGMPVVHLRLSTTDRVRILVEVWDRSAQAPTPHNATAEEEHGRGLMLVEALCERWGWTTVPGWTGKVVWAECEPQSLHDSLRES